MNPVEEARLEAEPARMTARVFDPARGEFEQIDPAEVSERLLAGALLWLDVYRATKEDVRLLREEFALHPLGMEEILSEHQRPRFTAFTGASMMVMYATGIKPEDGRVDLREVVIFVGQSFLITAHHDPLPEVEEALRRWRELARDTKPSIAAPLFALLDTLVDGIFPVTDRLAEEVDDIEGELFSGSSRGCAAEIFGLKRDLLALRRVVSGERDAVNELLRYGQTWFSGNGDGWMIYFESIYDHLVRAVDGIDTYRDLLSSALDMHLSVLSNRMNQVMKTLTAVSTILMSAGLVAGIYGMNFQFMPELHTRYGYFIALGGMAVMAAALAAFFRRIGWL